MGLVPPGADRPHFKPQSGMIKKIPRLCGFVWRYARFDRKAKAALPELENLDAYKPEYLERKSELEILESVEALHGFYQRLSHHTIICQLLMFIHHRILKSRLDKIGVDIECFDLTEGMDNLKKFDPNVALSALSKQFHNLNEGIQGQIRAGRLSEIQSMPECATFYRSFMEFLDRFGHLSDSTVNFSYPSWRETQDIIINILADFPNSYDHEPEKIRVIDLKENGSYTWILGLLYRRARLFVYLREAYSDLFNRCLGLLRQHYLALSDRLVSQGSLEQREDIFSLFHPEIRRLVIGEFPVSETLTIVAQRNSEMEASALVSLPELIYGQTAPPITITKGKILSGVPTSRGYFTGCVKVVHNLGDFHKLQEGDVLVIPFSDTSWLPLFAKASAVIAESGGMLSHSSIIAREYGIPAVVSVPGILNLEDNTRVFVDGFKGEIRIVEE